MTTKTCSKCGETRALSEFVRDKNRKDGLFPQCKTCNRAFRQANKEQLAVKRRAYNQANKEKIAEQKRAWRQSNKEQVAEYHRAYYQANKEEITERQVAYKKKRRSEDPTYAMVGRLRARLLQALNGKAKPASTMELLGCSREDLMAHLESQFTEGMTWENRSEWHIDHIKPIASFEDPADPACWHYSNLQPLWAEDNIRKGDSWDGEESALEG